MNSKLTKATHTPGPWSVDSFFLREFGDGRCQRRIKTSEIGTYIYVEGPDKPTANANADRIVTSINAVAGIDDPRAALKAAREALTEALPVWANEDDGDEPYDSVAGEISVADMRRMKRALALLNPQPVKA